MTYRKDDLHAALDSIAKVLKPSGPRAIAVPKCDKMTAIDVPPDIAPVDREAAQRSVELLRQFIIAA